MFCRTVLLLLALSPVLFKAQQKSLQDFQPDPAKVQKFLPYLEVRHGGPVQTEQWKSNNKLKYLGELWYYTESFSVRRDHLSSGVPLDESIIDISRFEHLRRPSTDTVIVIPGYRDGLVLLAADQLIYKP